MARIELDGIGIDAIGRREFLDRIMSPRGGLVITPNLDHLRRARSDPSWRAVLRAADVVVADGMPLLWASRLQGTPLPERMAGSDLFWDIAAAAEQHGRSVFLLGGATDTAERTAALLSRRHPALLLAGWAAPRVDASGRCDDEAGLQRMLVAAAPDVILVGLGSPKQELLAVRLRPALPASWFIGVGVSFSFACGEIRRAPLLLQRCGLEWLHRLAQEPRRLAERYLVHGLPYAIRLLAGSALRGWRRRISQRR